MKRKKRPFLKIQRQRFQLHFNNQSSEHNIPSERQFYQWLWHAFKNEYRRAEQSGFFRHHVVLGGGVAYAADFKSGGIPLAEHVFAYGAFLVRGVSPKVEIFEFLLAAAGGLKVG